LNRPRRRGPLPVLAQRAKPRSLGAGALGPHATAGHCACPGHSLAQPEDPRPVRVKVGASGRPVQAR
jgi:hypothetical protein